MDKIIIADAGPLIALAGINNLSLLSNLFSTVWVTSSVKEECLAKSGKDSSNIAKAIEMGWLKEKEVIVNPDLYSNYLGDGEISSIEWAKQLTSEKCPCLIILDDKLARKYAFECKLNFIGTVSLLDIAEKKGLIKSAELLIQQISLNGYRISINILQQVRLQYGDI